MATTVILMGAPGAGKGTQARLITEVFGFPHISTGELLREIAKQETPLAEQVRQAQAGGKFVSDEILADLVTERTSRSDCQNGYILDGYPRTRPQLEFLETLVHRQGTRLIAIEISVPREVLFQRLTGRRTCGQCGAIYNVYFVPPGTDGTCNQCGSSNLQIRDDDQEDVVDTRLTNYAELTEPLIRSFQEKGVLRVIDGNQEVEAAFAQLKRALESESAAAW